MLLGAVALGEGEAFRAVLADEADAFLDDRLAISAQHGRTASTVEEVPYGRADVAGASATAPSIRAAPAPHEPPDAVLRSRARSARSSPQPAVPPRSV